MRLIPLVEVAVVLAACSSSTGPGSRYFVANVDSITTPNVIPASGPMRVVIWYNLVDGQSCNRVDHLQAEQTPGTLDLTVIGYRSTGPCSNTFPTTLPMAEFDAQPPFTSPFIITAHQRDGSALSRTLYDAD